MKIEDLDMFDMEPPPFDGCEILCKYCDEWSSHTEWPETEIPCEDCGEHYAMKCPKCNEVQSSVSSDILKVH